MWPFGKKKSPSLVTANSVVIENGEALIDVRGQTCPGYLLAINKAVEQLADNTKANLLITYPPCGEDVKAWCKEKNVEYIDLYQQADETWIIQIKK